MSPSSRTEKPLLRLLSYCAAKARSLCFLLILFGYLGLLTLPLLDRQIRFDEKGLLAGVALPTLRDTAYEHLPVVRRISRRVAASFHHPQAASLLATNLSRPSVGLHMTLTTPLIPSGVAAGPAPSAACRCHNLHTVIRSGRGDGLESLAIVTPVAFAPQRPDPSYDGRYQTADGAELAVAVGTALALHLRRGGGGGGWLARDLVWVVPDMACGVHQCLTAWAEAYHGDADAPGDDPGSGSNSAFPRGGVIQQALVLEALGGAFDSTELLLHGPGGLLPKLDTFYLLRYFFGYPTPPALWRDSQLAGLPERLLPREWGQAAPDYAARLLAGLHFAWQQAVGLPAGPHAAFKRYMVDAATVRLVQRGSPSAPSPAYSSWARMPPDERVLALGCALELCLRSLNNLVERFHHSSFLYLLTGPDRYVSVERYVGPAAALAAAVQLQAAWSMHRVRAAGGGTPRLWAAATARAAARTAALAAAAAAVRALACTHGSGSGAAALERAKDAVRRAFAAELSSPQGLLAAACAYVLAAGVAVLAAAAAGRLVSGRDLDAASKSAGPGTAGQADADPRPASARTVPGPSRAVEGGGQEAEAGAGAGACASAAWHAERVLVLTACAAALAALICLNWAAGFAAGAYLAPLALLQGLAANPAGGAGSRGSALPGGRARRGVAGVLVGLLCRAAWAAMAPLGLLCAVALAAGGGGGEGPEPAGVGSVADGVCGMPLTNYGYAHVVALSFWVFGLV